MNSCKYCGNTCKYNTCNHTCAAKLHVKLHPDHHSKWSIAGNKSMQASARRRWVKRMIELIPNAEEIFTKEQRVLIVKALAAQHRFSYNRGYSKGSYI